MKQINSFVASMMVSGLLVLGMVGIGVNALTTPGSVSNNASAQSTVNANGLASERSRQSDSNGRIRTRTNGSLERAEANSHFEEAE